MADWSERPLPDTMRDYAAHDSHNMIFIAYQLLQKAQLTNDQEKIDSFYRTINDKVLNTAFVPKQDVIQDDTYRQFFRKCVDIGFDP